MRKPVYVLAGQSNASRLSDQVEANLTAVHGAGNYTLVHAYAPGAPLTREKDGHADWQARGELRSEMISQTLTALRADPNAELAGVIWAQGEADTYNVGDPETYAARFVELIHEFRLSLAIELGAGAFGLNGMRVVISGLSDNAPDAEGRVNWSLIQAMQEQLAADNDWITCVDPDEIAQSLKVPAGTMFADGLHYGEGFLSHLADALVDHFATRETASNALQRGTDGNDVFPWVEGPTRMVGGLGNDTYYVDDIGDRIVELAGEGSDMVFTAISFSLRDHSQHIERLELTGSDDIDGTGNLRVNVIVGNDGDNVLNGALGSDTLIGGGGNDTFRDDRGADRMVGGTGDDVYHVDNRRDVVVEAVNEGHDTIFSSVSIALRNYGHDVEDLILKGAENIDATGNGADNLLRGNRGDNTIFGGWGDDLMIGRAGNDVFSGGRGDDRAVGGAGADTFIFAGPFGHDVIVDFDPTQEGERIDLSGVANIKDFDDLVGSHLRDTDNGVVIVDGAGSKLTLRGLDASDLGADDFIF